MTQKESDESITVAGVDYYNFIKIGNGLCYIIGVMILSLMLVGFEITTDYSIVTWAS